MMKIYVNKSGEHGRGVFAKEKMKQGDVIAKIEFTRQITAKSPRMAGEKFEHQFYMPNGKVFLVKEPYCYFNHSCSPNAWLFSIGEEYYLIAKNDIDIYSEITADYELSAVDDETWVNICGGDISLRRPDNGTAADEWKCTCGSESCRGLHKWNFFNLPRETILKNLPYLDPMFVQILGKRIQKILEN
ncbi:MAG: SET domain-containing protein-lysine N-methyltransferase [Synergistaceae bacterium]|nr:SET domain-containing protein-lysine N-methyltransferase [Synergistaceae bacterium]